MSPEEADQILARNGYRYDCKTPVSQFGGLGPFISMLDKAGLYKRLKQEFGHFKARTLLQLVVAIVGGAKTMQEVARIGRDPLVKRLIKEPVKEAQLYRNLSKFQKQEIEDFHDFVINIAIYDLLDSWRESKLLQAEDLIFDIDATAVKKYGEQEGVEYGYLGSEESIAECYQYLFFRLENRNTFLYGTVRGGAAHSQNNINAYLSRFLPLFEKRWKTIWRSDSGYFNEESFDLYTENDATFFVKAPMIEERLRMAAHSPDLVWQYNKENSAEYASRITCTKAGTKYREVFKRREKASKQQSLFKLYRYDCIATNDLVKEEEQVFSFYNQRANIENNIKELKHDYHLGQIVSKDFDTNDVITQATLLSYLLVAHFKSIALPPAMQKMRLSTLRWRIFNIAGRVYYNLSRKFVTKVYNNVFVPLNFYADVFLKIEQSLSWVLKPPDMALD